MNSTKSGSYTPEKSVVTPASPVADSGTPPADLAGLREWNASRNPSSIIADKVATLRERLADPSTPPAAIPGLEAAIRRVEKQRDPAAHARMAAKVAVDKLEARLADTNSNRLKFYLEINGEPFTLVLAAAGYWVYQGDTRLGIIEHDDGEGHWIAHQEHLGKVRKGHFSNAPAAVVYLYYLYMRRSHRVGIESHTPYLGIPPRNITTFRWSGPEQPRDLEDRRVDEEAHKLLSHARDQGGTLEMALEDFRDFDPSLLGEMGERVLNRAQDLDGEVATSAPRRRYRSSLNPYRRGDY